MTTVVADSKAGVMVADSRASDDECGLKESICKIERIGDALYGTAGDVEDCERMMDWFRSGRHGPKPKVKDFRALVLSPCGLRVWEETSRQGYKSGTHIAAIGSGANAALGAIMAGAGIEAAVKIACKIDTHSEEPIHVVRLN